MNIRKITKIVANKLCIKGCNAPDPMGKLTVLPKLPS